MSYQFVKHSWLRNKRRISDPRGVLERRWFKAQRRQFYDQIWREAAEQIGAQVKSRSGGLTQITRAGLTTFVDQADLMLDSAIAIRVMENKTLTYKLMDAKGLRTPRRCEYDLSTIGRAEDFMAEIGGPIVVKPADGTAGGYGITTGIVSKAELQSASWHASEFHAQNRSLLAEEQLTGSSFRLLYLDGEYIDAVRRDSPVVMGDGRSTVRHLVVEENRRRRSTRPMVAVHPLIIDQESRNTLGVQGLSPASVPANGEMVRVKLAVNQNARAQNHVVRDEVDEELIRVGSRLVRDLGIRFAGLDVTSHDISAPLGNGETIFNEINTSPGVHHHYLVANPEQGAEIAPLILEWMFSTGSGVIRL